MIVEVDVVVVGGVKIVDWELDKDSSDRRTSATSKFPYCDQPVISVLLVIQQESDTLLFDGQTDTVHMLPEDCR